MIAYQDPEHKGNSAAYHSGKPRCVCALAQAAAHRRGCADGAD